jgi:ubiquinone/menaquinone biosynthesis C-methylase UbiE
LKNSDKIIEKNRYGSRARSRFNLSNYDDNTGSNSIVYYLRQPYLKYEDLIRKNIKPKHNVLELGSGEGRHTKSLLETGANIVATDISADCVSFLKLRFANYNNLIVSTADIELIPFPDSFFDVVCCAGSLSYGDPSQVYKEVLRVLKKDGDFLVIDSLNHNPVYRINRWVRSIRGDRSNSTLINMPDVLLINAYCSNFSSHSISYYGSIAYALPFLSFLFGEETAYKISSRFDDFIGVYKSAFKFVLLARGLNK